MASRRRKGKKIKKEREPSTQQTLWDRKDDSNRTSFIHDMTTHTSQTVYGSYVIHDTRSDGVGAKRRDVISVAEGRELSAYKKSAQLY